MVVFAFGAIHTLWEVLALHLVPFLQITSRTGVNFASFIYEEWFAFPLNLFLGLRTAVLRLFAFEFVGRVLTLRSFQAIPLAYLFVKIILVPVFELQEELCNDVGTAVLEDVIN